MPMSKFFMLGALAGTAAALFVAARRQAERAESIKDMVARRDWESASPVKPMAPGGQMPPPEEVAEEVTGIPNKVSDALTK